MVKNNKYVLLIGMILAVFAVVCLSKAADTQQMSEETDVSFSSEQELEDIQETPEAEMPVMADIIIGDNYYIALYEDGSVWSWGNNESCKLGVRIDETDIPQKVDITGSVVKIMDGGRTIWALTDVGDIYVWGEAVLREPEKGKRIITQQYITPVKLEDIPPIEKLSVRNNHAAAVGNDGELYLWGVITPAERFPSVGTTKIILKQVQEDFRELVTGVQDVNVGGGGNYCFMRDDGTVFLMMFRQTCIDKGFGYIFPNENEEQKDITYYWPYEISEQVSGAVILNPEDDLYDSVLYWECQNIMDADMISSDEYTMFLYKEDATLCYWMSDRAKYHKCTWLTSYADDGLEHSMGQFEDVNIREIMNIPENEPVPRIIDMFSNCENTLFLTDNGELFMSSYITDRIADVEYYTKFNPDPGRLPLVETQKNVELKRIAFEKLDYYDIVSINGDGQYHFSAVDSKGNYYHIKASEE